MMRRIMRKMVISLTDNNINDVAEPHDNDVLDPLLDSSMNTLQYSSDRIDGNSTMEVDNTNNGDNQDDEEAGSIDDQPDDDVYEVQEIIDIKYIRKAKYFLIRWKNFTEADDTWELESALSCPELIAQYLETHPDKKQPPKNKDSKMSTKQSSLLKETPPTKRRSNVLKETPPAKHQSSALKKRPPARRQSSTTPIRITKRRDSIILTKHRSSATKVSKAPTQTEYEVDKIVDQKLDNGQMLFRIRWKGYGAKDDTWEPKSNLNSPLALSAYLSGIKGSTEADEGRQVMKIIGEKIIKRKWYFLVQWKGCDENESTWEDVNSVDCDDQIENFRKLRRPTVAADNVTRKRRSDAASPKIQETPKMKRGKRI